MSDYKLVQIGSDIDDTATYESANNDTGLNKCLSISADGTIVAIGSNKALEPGPNQGYVRIFKNNSGTWEQIGSPIAGEALGDNSGVVSISDDGSIVAIGASGNDGNGDDSGHVRIYKNNSGTWEQIGSDIDGEASSDRSGSSLSLSADGSIVAIGAYGSDGFDSDSGHVRIYKNNGGTWEQIGSDIDGQLPDNYQRGFGVRSGISVSLSDDGSVVAIGAQGWEDFNGYTHGEVRIFENNSGDWNQIGDPIDDLGDDDKTGQRVSLSGDGNVLAVSAWNNGANVRIYERDNNLFTETKVLTNTDANFGYGYSVSLSEDGSVIAIGSLYESSDGNYNEAGKVYVYKKISGIWESVGEIDGESNYDRSGSSVAISDDGTTVAIGAPWNDGGGNKSGHVRLYQIINNTGQASFDLSISGTTSVGQSISINVSTLDPEGIGFKDYHYSWQSSTDGSNWEYIGNTILEYEPYITKSTTTVGETLTTEVGSKITLNANGTISISGTYTELINLNLDQQTALLGNDFTKVDAGGYGQLAGQRVDGSLLVIGYSVNNESTIYNLLNNSFTDIKFNYGAGGAKNSSDEIITWGHSSYQESVKLQHTIDFSTHTLASSEEGKKVRAVITYTDGSTFSESVTTSSVDVKTDDGDAVFAISGITEFGKSLSITESTADPDGTGSLSYVWQSSADETTWVQIGTEATYTITSSEENKKVRAILAYSDGQGFSESITTSSVNIKTIDDGDSAFAISGTNSVGESLSITESTADPDGTGTLSYVWQSSPDETTWTQIGTDSIYTLTSSDEGKKVRAIISYTDGQNFSEEVTTTAVNIPYFNDGDAFFEISGTAAVGQTLNITESTVDPDGTGTLYYNWIFGDKSINWYQGEYFKTGQGEDFATLEIIPEYENQHIWARVDYTDGQGFIEEVKIAGVNIPYVNDGDAFFVISGIAAVGQTLSILETAADPDGTGTLFYVWQSSSDETTWSQIGTDSTYTLTSSEEGKKVRAIVSYTDGQGFAEEVTSSSIDINQRIYELSTSINVPQEEYTLTTTVNTENVIEGSTLYWSLSGTNITLSDFSDGLLTGSGTVGSDGTFSFKHSIASDGETEGYETIDIKLFSDSDRTTQVAATEILIRDAALEEQIAEVVEDVNGVKKIVSQLVQGQNYTLSHIRDYDGNLHAGSNDEETAAAYKYQHTLDINGDGIEEAIYTNMKSGRWVTASIDPETGKIDYSDYGKEGTTRVVGIYDDPLIAVGLENNGFLPDGVTPAPAQFGATGSDRYVDLNGDGDFDDDNEDRLALNSQVRFQNDLKIDNLVAKLSNDFDSDGVREVFWRTSDNSAYLRALMHADGNIRYANYQNEQQMTQYLTDNGFDESTISEIIA